MYNYQEYNPDFRLAPWVKNYWWSDGFVSSDVLPKVFPDGCTDVMFIFDKTAGTSFAGIFGMMTSFVSVDFPASTQVFGIRFKPAAIAAFTRVPVSEFTDRAVEFALVDSWFDKAFYETLPEKQSVEEIIIHTNNQLIKQLSYLYHFDQQINHAVHLIRQAKGNLSLADVASDICLCQRHFERKFKSIVGVSPKMFAKIFRFKHAAQYLQNCPHKDLLTIAVECGYYDHAHLIKDFKSLSGNAPKDFRN